MRVSAASDLHLEVHDTNLPGGDVLLLAGDCFTAGPCREWRDDATNRSLRKRYARFAKEELGKYGKVFYVLGNHDFYRDRFEDSAELLSDFLAEHAPHAKVLDNETVVHEGVAFTGCTLWAAYGHGTYAAVDIQRNMNDFALIRTLKGLQSPGDGIYQPSRPDGRTITVQDVHEKFEENVKFLRDALTWTGKQDLPTIVITHHAPSYLSRSRRSDHADNGMDEAYYSNQHALIEQNPQLKVWVHGHTHDSCRYKIGECQVTSNQRGYFPSERASRYFDPGGADFDLGDFAQIER